MYYVHVERVCFPLTVLDPSNNSQQFVDVNVFVVTN